MINANGDLYVGDVQCVGTEFVAHLNALFNAIAEMQAKSVLSREKNALGLVKQ
jgi:hypothetical protein